MAGLEFKPGSLPPETICLTTVRFVELILDALIKEETVAGGRGNAVSRIVLRALSTARKPRVSPSGGTYLR